MKNEYKRRDVFRCNQEAHRDFEGRVSVYHVMKEKACYPRGCLYFLWHCTRFEKGERCIHGYRFVGKNCRGCTYYDAEKVHLQPVCLLGDEAYQSFLDSLESFESWLESIRFRRRSIAGRIAVIKPWFERSLQHREAHLRLRGYLLIFKKGFIGRTPFDDTFYVRIPEKLMQQMQLLPKMKVELEGEVREDRGRIIIHKPRKVEILSKGWGRPLTRSSSLVAVKTATYFKHQPERCLTCVWGSLVDVTDRRNGGMIHTRHLYCLKGIQKPEDCVIPVLEKEWNTGRE